MNELHRELMETFYLFPKLRISSMMPDISHTDWHLLTIISRFSKENEEKGIRISDMARKMHVSVPSMSRTIRHMEESGYIKRVADEKDRRNTYVELTKKGKDILERAFSIMQEFADAVFTRLGEENTRQLNAVMKELYQICEEEIQKRSYKNKKEKGTHYETDI